MAKNVPITVDTERPEHAELLTRAAFDRFKDTTELRVTPTTRLGRVETRLFRVRAVRSGGGMSNYYYSKIGQAKLLRDEFAAYRKYVRDQLPQASEAWLIAYKGLACLSSIAAGLPSSNHPTALVDVLERGYDVGKVSAALARLYGQLFLPWHAARQVGQIEWFRHYEWYLRWSRTTEFVQRWIGSPSPRKFLVARGKKWPCPIETIERLRDERAGAEVFMRPVHGDLHQRNIIVDPIGDEYNPWLIDFEWTQVFHSMVDYVLLEASLKIFHFSRYISEDRYMSLHDVLAGDSRRVATAAENEMIEVIRTIRRYARKEVGSEGWPGEYYTASLLVAAGLLSVPTCPVRICWLTAAWMANQIA